MNGTSPSPTPSLNIREARKTGRMKRRQMPRRQQARLNGARESIVAVMARILDSRWYRLREVFLERITDSPLNFFRGTPAVMASDLAKSGHSGILVQSCGDCHLLNFGGFATPERRIIFDLNDFDETALAPFEWDLKRLATSFILAAREKDILKISQRRIARKAVASYLKHIRRLSRRGALESWYARIPYDEVVRSGADLSLRRYSARRFEKAIGRTPHEKEFHELTQPTAEGYRLIDDPPQLFHPGEDKQGVFLTRTREAFGQYKASLSDDRLPLLDRYSIADVALRVGGVSSAGTVCGVILLLSDAGDPLLLQFKEAMPSAIAHYTHDERYAHEGRRVVEGQRLMQSASDLFLGWASGSDGRHFYVRQLADAKLKPPVERMNVRSLEAYAAQCGKALAHAHARSGKAAEIAGYAGKSPKLADAIADYAAAYARRLVQDFRVWKRLARQMAKAGA